jgi:hypothetical protein
MGNWKTERDALVSETLAFVRSVRSQARRHDVLEPMPHSGDEKGRSQSATFDDRVKPASDDPAVLSRLTPMNWGQPEREEIIQRVARFKAHQQLFTVSAKTLQ